MSQKVKIYEDSTNYTCQVIKLPVKIPVKGLDNLVEVNYQGNSVLISKDSPEDELYLFFPAECQISEKFLSENNLFRHETLNTDPTKKGFFEDNGRVKALKFKGVISSGFIIPVTSLRGLTVNGILLQAGDEFNEIDGEMICKKFVRKHRNQGQSGFSNPRVKMIDNVLDSRNAPEHPDTGHLLKNAHKLSLDDDIVITYKLHGTSARTYNTLVKNKLTWKEKLAKWFGVNVQEERYDYVACSRRQVKSIGFEELPNKNHFFTSGDLWSEWAKLNLDGKLNKGESIYYELVGKTYSGEEIQGGYSYGFEGPECFVYRIANINPQGIEIDLNWDQMVKRCKELGLKPVPLLFIGTLGEFIRRYLINPTGDIEQDLNEIFYNNLLEKPSIFDNSVVEEGFCVRINGTYPKAETFKIKSRKFILHETNAKDKGLTDLEEEQGNSTNVSEEALETLNINNNEQPS